MHNRMRTHTHTHTTETHTHTHAITFPTALTEEDIPFEVLAKELSRNMARDYGYASQKAVFHRFGSDETSFVRSVKIYLPKWGTKRIMVDNQVCFVYPTFSL